MKDCAVSYNQFEKCITIPAVRLLLDKEQTIQVKAKSIAYHLLIIQYSTHKEIENASETIKKFKSYTESLKVKKEIDIAHHLLSDAVLIFENVEISSPKQSQDSTMKNDIIINPPQNEDQKLNILPEPSLIIEVSNENQPKEPTKKPPERKISYISPEEEKPMEQGFGDCCIIL